MVASLGRRRSRCCSRGIPAGLPASYSIWAAPCSAGMLSGDNLQRTAKRRECFFLLSSPRVSHALHRPQLCVPGELLQRWTKKFERLVELLVSQSRRDGSDSILCGLSKRNRNDEDRSQMDGRSFEWQTFLSLPARGSSSNPSDLWSRTGNMVIDGRMSELQCEPQT